MNYRRKIVLLSEQHHTTNSIKQPKCMAEGAEIEEGVSFGAGFSGVSKRRFPASFFLNQIDPGLLTI